MSTVKLVAAEQVAADSAVVAMVVSASGDGGLCQATYLPAGLDAPAALCWIGAQVGGGYAIYLGSQPVGWLGVSAVKDSCGFDLPAGSAEFEIWLLPCARGKRVFRESLLALEGRLLSGEVTHLVGVAWVTNQSSVRAMRASGFEILGDGWWGDTIEGGVCTVGILQIGSNRSG